MTFCWSEFSPNHIWSFDHKMVQALLLNQISGQMSFWHFVTWEQNGAATFCLDEFCPNYIWPFDKKMVLWHLLNQTFGQMSFCHFVTWEKMVLLLSVGMNFLKIPFGPLTIKWFVTSASMSFCHFVTWEQNGAATFCCNEFFSKTHSTMWYFES